jgi:protein tyrosine phosphatase (PTP) superfamily phosphohydrolase (DUF442 family)
MMSLLDWFKAGGTERGTPRRTPRLIIRLMAVIFIGCTASLQTGCRSGPYGSSSSCNSCGGCGKCGVCGFFSRATNRIFHPNRVYSDSPVSGGVVEYGGTAGVVVPGTIPSYSSGGTMGTAPSNVTAPQVDTPSQLEPLPSAKPGAANGATGSSGSGARPTSYTTGRPGSSTAMRSSRGVSSTPANSSTPASRSAQDSSGSAGAATDGSLEDNFLDHLPPLGLPKEVTKSSASPPAPPAAPADAKTGAAAPAEPTARRAGAPTEAEFALTIAAEPAPETVTTAGVGAGITRFSTVDLNLAGGSSPSDAGLAWLSDKGYRTLLDLRDSSEVPPSFIAEVARRGLRYVALPVSLAAIDKDHVARFNFEIGSGDARPMFFFDSNGSRAGILWYIRRVTVDRVDPQIARREAEELGLVDKAVWSAATNYIQGLESAKVDPGPARSSQAGPLSGAATTPKSKGSEKIRAASGTDQARAEDAPMTFQDFLDEANSASERSRPKALDDSLSVEDTAGTKRAISSDPARPAGGDLMIWRPFAAILLTGLGIPLTYWTRTIVPDLLSKARASLPAPAQRPRSLPHESGA